MSSNLLKANRVAFVEQKPFVINANKRIEQKMESQRIVMKDSESQSFGFQSGLVATSVETILEEEECNIIGGEEVQEALVENSLEESPEDIREQLIAQAQEEATAIRLQAQKEADAILEEAQLLKANAYEEGKRLGYQEGEHKANSVYEQKQKELETNFFEQMDLLEPKFIEVISDIYETVIGLEFNQHGNIITHLIKKAMGRIECNHEYILRVNVYDFPLIRERKRELLLACEVENTVLDIIEDVTLKKNECYIETNTGIFDCSLDIELYNLRKKLRLLSYDKTEN
ncbi:MAG: FliH/SctL family protein [Lachnospiraceae bacterium]